MWSYTGLQGSRTSARNRHARWEKRLDRDSPSSVDLHGGVERYVTLGIVRSTIVNWSFPLCSAFIRFIYQNRATPGKMVGKNVVPRSR